MKRFLICCAAVLIWMGVGVSAWAQTSQKANVELSKEQKKEFKAYVDSVRFNKLLGAINDRHFLMQVDGVYFGAGPTEYGLNTASNFILL